MLALLAGVGQAQTSDIRERFHAADKNRDGVLDREEYHQLIVEMFFFRDTDKNGYLVISELEGYVSEAVFRAADRQPDGKLSLQEWSNALFADFDKADTNRDGVLSYEELDAYIRSSGK